MANDIDMWNDIEGLKGSGHKKIAEAMFSVYAQWFIEGNKKATEKAIKDAWKKHPNASFDFESYGIPEPRRKFKEVV